MHTAFATMIITLFVAAGTAVGATYSTEATLSLQKEEGTYLVTARVFAIEEQRGKSTEKLLAQPRIQSTLGVPATMYLGLQPSNPAYRKEENVTLDVTWPFPNESGVASCTITIKRGDTLVSKSKLQLQVEGPGRSALILTPAQVDPKSVRVVNEQSKYFLFLEFNGKTKQEVKKLALENYGNKVRVQDPRGIMTEAGISFGTYKEHGITLHFDTVEIAEHVARILRGENPG